MPNEHSEYGVFLFLYNTLCVLIVKLIEILKKNDCRLGKPKGEYINGS